MEKWKAAYSDYKSGLKYKEIAEKHGVSLNTVKSWKVRFWNGTQDKKCANKTPESSKSVRTKIEKGVQTDEEKLVNEARTQKDIPAKSHGRNGAPIGNKNAVGNKGGAPKGNANHLKHGIYARLKIDALSPEEHDYLLNGKVNVETELELMARLGNIQIAQFLEKMAETSKNPNGLVVGGIEKAKRENKNGIGDYSTITTSTASSHELVLKYSEAIERVRRQQLRCLELMKQMGMDAENGSVQILDNIPDTSEGECDD